MGCGISRIHLMEEGMAYGGLNRRIVQVRSRNDILATHHDPGTSSTKMLLKEDQSNTNIHGSGDASDSHNSRGPPDLHVDVRNYKDISPTGVDASPVIKDPPVQQQIRGKEYLSADHDQRHLGKSCESPLITKKMGMSQDDHVEHTEKETNYHHGSDDDGEEGRMISNYDGATLIGSPSFREYCVDHESDDHDVVNHGDDSNGGLGKKENRTQLGMDEFICNDEVCIRGEEVPKKHIEKKGSTTTRSGSKFRKVMFPMHMKTRRKLWNVTACYSRANHHHHRVLPASATKYKLPEN